jgi:ligand-binding SRPBCC domain-containing protein
MADYVLERRQWVPRRRADVFAFFAEPRRLAFLAARRAAPDWITPPPSTLRAGAVIDFRARSAGVPVHWRIFVREFDAPYRFVDVQIKGPFARWEHRHVFHDGLETVEGSEATGTWVEDRVTYRLPFGAFGRLAHALVLRRRIVAALDARDRRLREALSREEAPSGPPSP